MHLNQVYISNFMEIGPSISSETLFTYRQTDIQPDILYKTIFGFRGPQKDVLQNLHISKTIKREKVKWLTIKLVLI